MTAPSTPTKTARKPVAITAEPPPASLQGKRLHFVGIGGCGMSGLAKMAMQAGATPTGSDIAATQITDALGQAGIAVTLEQSAQTVPSRCDLVVVSAAIDPQHPEMVEANRRGIPVIKYAQMLGRLMAGRVGVAIAGTHGKSTTASMLAHTLIDCGLDTSFIIGATCNQIGGGSRTGTPNAPLIAEACEFDRSFHHLNPTHGAILNVEEDHLDIYGSIDAIVEAFGVFAKRLPKHGSLLINHEMAHRLAITAGLDCSVETIGFAPQADWRIEVKSSNTTTPTQSRKGATGCLSASGSHNSAAVDATSLKYQFQPREQVRLYHHTKPVAAWQAAMPGEHMAYNAAAAAVTAHRLGAPWDGIAQALATFQGLDRRMQHLGVRRLKNATQGDPGVTVLDDYGHHPTEIDTTLRALHRHYKPKRLICVFQPHQHSRTRFLMEQFAASFSHADIVIVPHIYFVRDSEVERHAVSAADLVDRLRQRGTQAMHVYPFEAIAEQLEVIAQPGDLLVTMGAGDVWRVARQFLGTV